MSIYQKTITLATSNNATVISATPIAVLGIYASKITATACYLKLYNKATAPAPGSDAALLIHVQAIPANGSVIQAMPEDGLQFTTGCGIAVTTGATLADNTATAANDGVITITYMNLV